MRFSVVSWHCNTSKVVDEETARLLYLHLFGGSCPCSADQKGCDAEEGNYHQISWYYPNDTKEDDDG